MSPSEIARVEAALQIHLPLPYRTALETRCLSGDENNHPEFSTSVQRLIEDNHHFGMSSTGPPKPSGALGVLKNFLLYGSGRRREERWQRWYAEWVLGQRFIIGTDLSEERYLIVLSEQLAPVYCYQLETGQTKTVAGSPDEWLVEVKRRQIEWSA